MKILVVEDEPTVAKSLKLLLSSYRYAVDIATDGEAGLQMIKNLEYDLVLLDVILPKLDGISLCQQLRTHGMQVPILLLTGQEEKRQKAYALNAGADDYVVKPFDAEELIARVQALLRRGGAIRNPILSWGNLSIDPSSRKVTYGTQLLTMTPKEYAILELFLRNPQRIFAPRLILDHAWESIESPGEEAVRVHIKELRHKLKEAGAPKDFIKTVYRVGYRLNPLYSSPGEEGEDELTKAEIAELKSVNEELRNTLEELHIVQEELYQRTKALESVRCTLEHERQMYRELFEFAPNGYILTDRHGNIQDANRAAIALLSLESHWLMGNSLDAFIDSSERADFRAHMADLADLKEPDQWEVSFKPYKGEPFPVLMTVNPVIDPHGQVTGLRWSLHDLRYRQQSEQT